jgi:hypothetical protein
VRAPIAEQNLPGSLDRDWHRRKPNLAIRLKKSWNLLDYLRSWQLTGMKIPFSVSNRSVKGRRAVCADPGALLAIGIQFSPTPRIDPAGSVGPDGFNQLWIHRCGCVTPLATQIREHRGDLLVV